MSQAQIWAEGYDYLRRDFPKLDYFEACKRQARGGLDLQQGGGRQAAPSLLFHLMGMLLIVACIVCVQVLTKSSAEKCA